MITINNPASKIHQAVKSHKTSKISPTSKNTQASRAHLKSKINRTSKLHPASKINPTFEKARKQLRGLSNKKLLSDLEALNQRERKLKVLLLLYLSEIDKRRLYLPMGYSSLFDFCTMHLWYTRATAARRIRSARAVASYPDCLDLLLSGEINITTLSLISDILDRDNHEKILSEIRGKSTRQVELLVSTHKPVNIIRDTVRPVCVRRCVEESTVTCGSGPSAETSPGNPDAQMGDWRPANSNKSSSSAETRSGAELPRGRMLLEQRLKLGFTVSPDFMKKYNKIKSLLSGKHPEGINFEMLFDTLMTEYLEKHDPDRCRERRTKRASSRDNTAKQNLERHSAQKTERAGKSDKAGKDNPRKKPPASHRNSRHIPPAVRDQIYPRDKGRCTFVGANGKRCNSTWDLEVDHVVPVARGGDNSPGNLRLLCRKHNIYRAEREYGRGLMDEYIKAK